MSKSEFEAEIMQTARSLIGDTQSRTAAELAKLFTLAEVGNSMGVGRDVVRRCVGSQLKLAEAIRLADMEHLLAEIRESTGGTPASECMRRWCVRLLVDGYPFFLERGRIAWAWRERLRANLVEIARRGSTLHEFSIADLNGAALLVIDVLNGIVLSQVLTGDDVFGTEFERDDGEPAPLVESHFELLLRAWGARSPAG